MTWCLNRNLVTEFIRRLKTGEIEPQKLIDMGSKGRRDYFTEFLGAENAKQVNTLFESKLLLKNQQQGIITWAKQTAGIKPQALKDIVSKVNKMTDILQPENEATFLADIAEHKLGATVTMAEASELAELGKSVAEKKSIMETGGDRMEYGHAYVKFMNYVNDLKMASQKLTFKEAIKRPGKAIVEAAGASKSIKASFDNSAIFRQGWKTLFSHTNIWQKNARQSFVNIWNTFGGKAVMDELNADIVSRPNYELMQKAKLAVGTIEEAYPAQLPTLKKVPILGKAYKASETAFTAFVHKTRADIFDKYIEIAKKSGVDITDKIELQAIGKMVNALTGRSTLGHLESAANVVNNVFFSPRLLKSNIDVLTAHTFGKDITPFVRKQAAINLLKVVAGTATVLAIADAIKPGSVEKDPRSADFGKIRIKDTRFDVTGGMASVVTLASRLTTMSSKSSTTGKVTELNADKFGAQTGMDVIYNFFENKLSPVMSVIKDLLKGKDFQGNKPTVTGELTNLYVPLPVTTYQELANNPESANKLIAIIADALGISVNTYTPKPKKVKQKYK